MSTNKRWSKEETAILVKFVQWGFSPLQVDKTKTLIERNVIAIQAKMSEINKALKNNKVTNPLSLTAYNFIKKAKSIKVPQLIMDFQPKSVTTVTEIKENPEFTNKTKEQRIAEKRDKKIVETEKNLTNEIDRLEKMKPILKNKKLFGRAMKALRKVGAKDVSITSDGIHAKF